MSSALPVSERIDALMDRASRLLVDTDYFEAIDLCLESLRLARSSSDWERLSRICLPLQECRRQIRQLAISTGLVQRVSRRSDLEQGLASGMVLVEAPMIGADARAIRLRCEQQRLPVAVLAREPQNRKGLWPVVGVSNIVVRVRIEPPPVSENGSVSDAELAMWFENAQERLGDSAIESVDPAEPAAFRVDDLLERLDAVPDHEKLHQRLAEAARQAMLEPAPDVIRRRPTVNDPYSF